MRKTPPTVFDEFPSYKGGHTCLYGGYVWEFCPGHPLQNYWGWVPQHRLVAEDKMGRPLIQSSDEDVAEVAHHKDHCKTNNHPDNLEIMAKRPHRQYHARERAEAQKARLSRGQVVAALEGRSLKDAARVLKVDTMTIRNRFPDLVEPRKRKSPAKLDEAALIEDVRRLAADPSYGFLEISQTLRIGPASVRRIVVRNQIPWTRKSREGETHKTYCRKKPTKLQALEIVAEVRRAAADLGSSQSQVAKSLGISLVGINRILAREKIEWGRKDQRGQQRELYRKKPTRRVLASRAAVTGPEKPCGHQEVLQLS